MACVRSRRLIFVSISEPRLAGSLLSSSAASTTLPEGVAALAGALLLLATGGVSSSPSALRLERMDSAWLMELSALAMILRMDSSRLLEKRLRH